MKTHFLTGMGADNRIWIKYKHEFPNAYYHNWIYEFPKNYNYAKYSDFLIDKYKINDGDVVVGVSMGGIIGCEIFKKIKLAKLIQISSCNKLKQLNSLLSRMMPLMTIPNYNLINYLPKWILKTDEMKLSHIMYKECDKDFLKWAIKELYKWDGFKRNEKCVSIHGDKDFIFPIKKQKPDYIIQNGTHLMAYSNANEIIRIIKRLYTDSYG